MATTKPRVSITFPPELYDVLRQTADLRGVSFSAQVNEYLECAQPVMERTLTILRALDSRLKSARSGIDADMHQYCTNLEEAEKVLAPLLVAALHDLQPPHSNTGVTPPLHASNVGSTTKASDEGWE